jgi:hypothetical protein
MVSAIFIYLRTGLITSALGLRHYTSALVFHYKSNPKGRFLGFAVHASGLGLDGRSHGE